MSDERMQILRMIEQGKISAADGAQLLRALNQPSGEPTTKAGRATAEVRPRWLHVIITDAQTGKKKVNINIPLGLVNVGLKMGARFAPDISDKEYQTFVTSIQQAAQTGQHGKVMEMKNEMGDQVEVFVE